MEEDLWLFGTFFLAQVFLLPLIAFGCAAGEKKPSNHPTKPPKKKAPVSVPAKAPEPVKPEKVEEPPKVEAPKKAPPPAPKPKPIIMKRPKKPKGSTISQTILTAFKPAWLEVEYDLMTQGTQMWMDEKVVARTCREASVREKPGILSTPPPPPPKSVDETQDEMTDVTQDISDHRRLKKAPAPVVVPAPPPPPPPKKKVAPMIVEVDPKTGKKKVKVSDGNLLADPGIVNWSVKGGRQQLKLHNVSGKRIAIKVKCSDNGMFRVNPVLAFVEEDAELSLDIFRAYGNAKEDNLRIMNTPAKMEDKDPGALFKTSKMFSNLVVAQTFKE